LLVDVVLVGVVLEVGVLLAVELEEEELEPQPATASVLARTATAVRIALSGLLLIGRAPVFARGRERPPYQGGSA
jgi:hypothetical protein